MSSEKKRAQNQTMDGRSTKPAHLTDGLCQALSQRRLVREEEVERRAEERC